MKITQETLDSLKYDASGLIPAVVADAETNEVLMVAYMNKDSLADTVRTGKTHFWSRSRQKYWMKGESSGHTQEVKGIYTDCDMDLFQDHPRQDTACEWEGTSHKISISQRYYSSTQNMLISTGIRTAASL